MAWAAMGALVENWEPAPGLSTVSELDLPVDVATTTRGTPSFAKKPAVRPVAAPAIGVDCTIGVVENWGCEPWVALFTKATAVVVFAPPASTISGSFEPVRSTAVAYTCPEEIAGWPATLNDVNFHTPSGLPLKMPTFPRSAT